MRRHGSGMVPLAGVFAVNGALYGSLLPRFPQIAAQLGVSTSQFGLGLAGLGVGGVLGAFAATKTIRLMGGPLRTLQITGMGVLLAGVGAGASPSLLVFSGALVVLGLCDGFMDTAMNQVGGQLRRRVGASMMGRLHASLSVATLFGTAVGAGAAALNISVVVHLGIVALVLSVVLLFGVASLNRLHIEEDPERDREDTGTVTDDLPRSDTGVPSRRSRGGRARMWLILLVAGLTAVLIELPAQEWSGLLLVRELSTSAFVAGMGSFVAVGGVTLGRLVLDPAVNRFGWRRVAQGAGALSLAGTAAGLTLGSVLESPGAFLAGIGISALGAGVAAPLLFDRAAPLAQQVGLPGEAGPGLVSGVFRLGVLVSPLMVASLVEVSGLFVAMGVTAVAGALLVLLAVPLTAGPYPSE